MTRTHRRSEAARRLPAAVLAAAAFAAGWLAPAGPAAAQSAPDRSFFPVSVWYAGGTARAPMLETYTPAKRDAWARDLRAIKGLGFNTVRTWIEWTACEPDEGAYDFRALQAVCDLAAEAGLRVVVQVYIDSAPDWVARKFPDGRFVSSNGVAVQPQSAPGLCFDHPGVRAKVLDFFAAAARVVRDRPAFYGWDLWSEPHIINWAEVYYVGNLENVQFCYCASSQARFREWLKAKYGTLEGLNKAWYRTFRDWGEVEPPRYGTILTYTDYIDWKEFISDKLAQDLAAKSGAVKAVVPRGVTSSHSAIPGIYSRPDWSGTPDDRKMWSAVDSYGASIYPKHAWTLKPWAPFFRTAGHEFARSMGIGRNAFTIGELQAGLGVFGMKVSQPVVGADLRDWMWTAVAYGARAINIYAYYPMSSGYESGGYGLVDLDGRPTERAAAAGRVAATITKNMPLFLHADPPKARIAILYNPLSHMVGGQQSYTSEGLTVGANGLSESLQGVYRAFSERRLPVDFLHVADLSPERLGGYALLVVPYPVMMSRPHVAALVEYVRAGGTLLAEARCGWVDERGWSSPVIPGGGLDRALGCRESRLSPVAKTGKMTIAAADDLLPGLKPGDALDSVFFEEAFDVTDPNAKVLATWADGAPAAVASRFGKGRAVIVGSFLGLAYHHFSNPANARFLTALAEGLKIGPAVDADPAPAGSFPEFRLLENGGTRILFAFNRGERAAETRVRLPWSGAAAAEDLESGRPVEAGAAAGAVSIPVSLQPGEVRVIAVRPAGGATR